MESREQKKSWYQVVNGEKVEVSEQVYEEIRRDNNTIRYHAHLEQSCAQTSYRSCCGDCWTCKWHIQGQVESYDNIDPERNLSCASSIDIETEVLSQMILENVYRKADEIFGNGSEILKMRFEENLPVREIAKRLGVSHVSVLNRLDVMLNYFKAHKKVFF